MYTPIAYAFPVKHPLTVITLTVFDRGFFYKNIFFFYIIIIYLFTRPIRVTTA